jgi:chemotaxis signal transduction protein
VRAVVAQPRTEAINVGASYLSEMFELQGQPVGVLDMSRALRTDFRSHLVDRKLVVLAVRGCLVALAFDRVLLPEEIPAEALSPRPALSGADDRLLGRAIRAVARTDRGLRPILEPDEILSRHLLRRLAALVAQSSDEPKA